jgi:hypothetical protein
MCSVSVARFAPDEFPRDALRVPRTNPAAVAPGWLISRRAPSTVAPGDESRMNPHERREDGTVETTFHEGHTEEVRQLREAARQQGPAI